ncbi:hypothetical protein ANCCAN_27946 [Ancylostoma caninum]|uniref:Uncharacterized protein n=1 Tax=Ancylostoma caninum TaxID=29170 RepID=A0A368F3X0_ANCCA|nr:hypothetical protein ANCCAN_27946 [Ancylostoma caninum]
MQTRRICRNIWTRHLDWQLMKRLRMTHELLIPVYFV